MPASYLISSIHNNVTEPGQRKVEEEKVKARAEILGGAIEPSRGDP